MPNKKNFTTTRRASVATAQIPIPSQVDLKVLLSQITTNRSLEDSLELLTGFYEMYFDSPANNQTDHNDKLEQARFYTDMASLLEAVYAGYSE
jgi:hypothetical protein